MENQLLHQILNSVTNINDHLNKIEQNQVELKQNQVKLEQNQDEFRQDLQHIKQRLDVLEKKTDDTHGAVVILENTLTPKLNVLYETRSDLHPRVERLETGAAKLKFGA